MCASMVLVYVHAHEEILEGHGNILDHELMSAEGAKKRATAHVAQNLNSNYDWFPYLETKCQLVTFIDVRAERGRRRAALRFNARIIAWPGCTVQSQGCASICFLSSW